MRYVLMVSALFHSHSLTLALQSYEGIVRVPEAYMETPDSVSSSLMNIFSYLKIV